MHLTEEELRYPIGRFRPVTAPSDDERREWIRQLRELPAALEEALDRLPEGALDSPYRPGGWSVRQLVHHLADSHLNAYTRFRLALTEDHPTIRPYDQERWAELPDASRDPVGSSLSILRGLHARWASLLSGLPATSFRRTLHHPESGVTDLDALLQHYAWHGRHHVAQIRGVGPPARPRRSPPDGARPPR